MMETHHTFCRICEALCGLEVDVENGRVVKIRPDNEHVATEGFGCPKGMKQHLMYDSPDRLRYPLKRVDGEFVRVPWEQAIREIGAKVAELRGERSADAIAMYVGTAAGFGVLHPVFAQGFMTGIGSGSMYASATQDCANKFAVSRQIYGFPFTLPFPDVDRTECLIIVGANPVVSKWSFLQVSNPSKRIKDIGRRGGKVWVVDPRRGETAKIADEHVFIRPNTDVFFYLAFLNELLATGAVDHEMVAQHTTGFEQLESLAAPWTPERAEKITKIPAAVLREMVASYAQADGAALYCSTGVNMGTNGSLCYWIQEAINCISGNLDRPGGTLVGSGVIDFAKFGKKSGTLMREDRSRIGNFGAVNDAFPGGILPDEILTPGAGQVRALFVTGGNPLLTMANSNRLREAFKDLELLVTLDIYLNETSSLAHYVLPCTSPLQRPDLPFIFPMMLGLQSRPYMQATKAVVEPDGEQRDEASIYLDLCRASGVNLFGSALAQRTLELSKALHSRRHPDKQPALPQEGMLSLMLRLCGQGSFNKLLKEKHGRERAIHTENFLTDRIVTDDGRVQLAPIMLLDQCAKLDADYERELAGDDKLRLITKRQVTTHNSWTHNIEEFVEADRTTNYLYVHPQDAADRGLKSADIVDVESATGIVRLPIKILADLMPGTVALPHGWGHQHAKGLSVAGKTSGVNVNILAADGAENLERVSGMAHLTGIAVIVRPAAGPRAIGNWSGIADASTASSSSRIPKS